MRVWTACRVKFDTQQTKVGKDMTLIEAAKAFFANSRPAFWTLTAFLAPTAFLPVLRVLSRAFPTKTDLALEDALATVYEVSDALIKVRAASCSVHLSEEASPGLAAATRRWICTKVTTDAAWPIVMQCKQEGTHYLQSTTVLVICHHKSHDHRLCKPSA